MGALVSNLSGYRKIDMVLSQPDRIVFIQVNSRLILYMIVYMEQNPGEQMMLGAFGTLLFFLLILGIMMGAK